MKGLLSEQEQRRYTSYLLRLWQVRSEDGIVWRASIESAHTGERIGFASLADLFAFFGERDRVELAKLAAPGRGREVMSSTDRMARGVPSGPIRRET
jgi:hypothetical protein